MVPDISFCRADHGAYVHGKPHAHDAREYAGLYSAGLCHHRPREGGQKEARHHYHHVFRNALIPDYYRGGQHVWHCALRRCYHRAGLFDSGSWKPDDQRDYDARLSAYAAAVLLLAVSFSLVNLLIDLLLMPMSDRAIRAQFAGKSTKKKKAGWKSHACGMKYFRVKQ
jgi:hypothetical protein